MPVLSLCIGLFEDLPLKGAGFSDLVTPLLALAAFGVSIMTLGSLRFQKRLG